MGGACEALSTSKFGSFGDSAWKHVQYNWKLQALNYLKQGQFRWKLFKVSKCTCMQYPTTMSRYGHNIIMNYEWNLISGMAIPTVLIGILQCNISIVTKQSKQANNKPVSNSDFRPFSEQK